MQTSYRIGGIAALVFGMALAISPSQAGTWALSGAAALQAEARTATLLEPAVVVVRRRPVVRGCVWVRGRRVC
jgi:hypothetical protein